MKLSDATRMILAESTALPDLMRVTRYAYTELSAGRLVHHADLSGMLKEAGRQGVLDTLKHKHSTETVNEMITVLAREIDRQAPAGARR